MDLIDLPPEPMLCSGHAACPGCVDALSVRHVLAIARRDDPAEIAAFVAQVVIKKVEAALRQRCG